MELVDFLRQEAEQLPQAGPDELRKKRGVYERALADMHRRPDAVEQAPGEQGADRPTTTAIGRRAAVQAHLGLIRHRLGQTDVARELLDEAAAALHGLALRVGPTRGGELLREVETAARHARAGELDQAYAVHLRALAPIPLGEATCRHGCFSSSGWCEHPGDECV